MCAWVKIFCIPLLCMSFSSKVVKTRSSSLKLLSMLNFQESELVNLFDNVRSSVVYVSKLGLAFDPLLLNVNEVASQSGSGFVWDEDHVVTNFHVVGSATSELQVTFLDNDGIRYACKAKVRGVDEDKDIAVLKLSDAISNCKPVLLGNSSDLRVGQFVIAIGSPYGLDHSLSTGVISGLGRQIQSSSRRPIFNMIQTDAAINPGNSGGPLMSSSGRLIGMNTAIYSPSGAFSGIGFAIPVDTLKAVVSILIREGKTMRPVTGIRYVGGDQVKSLGIFGGILITSVDAGSPAFQAGLRGISRSQFLAPIALGDIIVAVEGRTVRTEADFLMIMDGRFPGETLELTILRSISSSSSLPVARSTSEQFKNAVELKIKLRLK